MPKAALHERQQEILQEERRIATELQACLAGFVGTDAHAETLRQVTSSLEDLFLLVVVGEFNSGKSALLNTLLRQEVMEEGVLPTTSQIAILRYGEQRTIHERETRVQEISYPADFLQNISIVDTPGVNAVLREHEQLTEDFIPRSDLILFLTSVDRPFTQSERLFLERIRSWGKKIIIILNKIDLLRVKGDLAKLVRFVRDNCKQLLGFQPEIFPLSVLKAQQAQQETGTQAIALWNESQFGKLEEYLFQTLDAEERIRLKFLSPLGVMQRIWGEAQEAVEQRSKLLAEDARTVQTIEEQLEVYREDMEQSFSHRLGEIENIILNMQVRGNNFFDDTIRLGRIFDLIKSERIRHEFEQEVTGDSAAHIDAGVQELIDWMVEQEHRLWQNIMEYLDRRRQTSVRNDENMIGAISRQFDYNRRTLLQAVARQAQNVVQSYNRQAEAEQLSQDLRYSVTQAAIAGAGGIGLGAAIVALVGTAAADVSGILAGAVLLSLGLYIIPARRKKAKQEFEIKMAALRKRLHNVMQEQFRRELHNSMQRVRDSIAPYTRFVRTEQKRVETTQAGLSRIEKDINVLRIEIQGPQPKTEEVVQEAVPHAVAQPKRAE
ncbi:dynamin family protein [Ktedonospora formicarum]|uniref:Dynamin n=1 Tax=Ktedonospora formicarum TaxID=2778364 RepID=A0A8J3HT71_9CHLR|nr:dynamin family protein [Ktedonospora formicarum]GHO43532.1 dynamin [Ktedonospora formicarum]